MAVQVNPAPGEQIEVWRQHWQDEGDAAYLYRKIAAAETDPGRARIFEELAVVEDRHVARWAEILQEASTGLPPFRPSLRARLLALVGRLFGWKILASIMLAEEGREVKGYLRDARVYEDVRVSQVATDLARESAEHAERLGSLLGTSGEPWHRIESGGFLRNAVYGFNDGLTANFGLVMGVLGASVPHHIILVSGVAGLFADALSMGRRGLPAAVGALTPVLPFILFRGPAAIGTAFIISMLAHFGVGAARSIFTARGVFRSGVDMFLVGPALAGIGYLVGEWIQRVL